MTDLLTSQSDPPDQLIPPDGIKVHDGDVQGTISDLLPGNIKLKSLEETDLGYLFHKLCYLIEYGVKIALVDRSLLLLHPFLPKHQPHLHIRV